MNNSTVNFGLYEKSPNSFLPGLPRSIINQFRLSQSPLPVPCKRSSAAPIPFGFRLSVARSRRFALPVTARSAPCGFVPLRRSRRNTVLRTLSYMPLFLLLYKAVYFLFFMYSSMLFAQALPAPIASITVAAPVTASPPANTPSRAVTPPSSASMPPLRVKVRPSVVLRIQGVRARADGDDDGVNVEDQLLPGTGTGLRRPFRRARRAPASEARYR